MTGQYSGNHNVGTTLSFDLIRKRALERPVMVATGFVGPQPESTSSVSEYCCMKASSRTMARNQPTALVNVRNTAIPQCHHPRRIALDVRNCMSNILCRTRKKFTISFHVRGNLPQNPKRICDWNVSVHCADEPHAMSEPSKFQFGSMVERASTKSERARKILAFFL